MSSLPSFMNWGFKPLKEEDSKNLFVLGGKDLFLSSNPTIYYELIFSEWLAPNNCRILNSNGDFEFNKESFCYFQIRVTLRDRHRHEFNYPNTLLFLQPDVEDMIIYYHEISGFDTYLDDIDGFCNDLSMAFNNIYDRGAVSKPDKHDKDMVDTFFQKIDKVKSYNAGEWKW